MTFEWNPLWLTFKLAATTAGILFLLGIPLAWFLTARHRPWVPFVEALISLPLVLPPTVIGFYFLLLLGPSNEWMQHVQNIIGTPLLFSFQGLVVASVLYSLPFMMHPLISGFRSLPPHLQEASYLLGKSKWQTLLKIQIPLIKTSLLTGGVLSFAHAIGEFGVVLMIGGNIPRKTRVASVAIYDQVESLQFENAHIYSFTLFVICFSILLLTHFINYRRQQRGF